MPELPEVECVVLALRNSLPGKRIAGVEFVYTRMLQNTDAAEFTSLLCGRKIVEIKRRGKYILFFLSGETVLEVHLRMTGRFFFNNAAVAPGPYTGAVFQFEDGSTLHFQDIRKLGTFRLWQAETLLQSPAYRLGPDLLDDSFDFSLFARILEHKKSTGIKSLLLNQKYLAGLGNIYTDEALHLACIHPARTAGSLLPREKKQLFEAIMIVLREGIAHGGTTFFTFRDIQGQPGHFQEQLRVYRRERKRCLQCATPIARTVIAGRGTYYCPACQPRLANPR